jgi:hypothetical protein
MCITILQDLCLLDHQYFALSIGTTIYIIITIITVTFCIMIWWRLRTSKKLTTHGPVGWRGSHTGEDTVTLPIDSDDLSGSTELS